jgi:hypothetical protein
MAAGLGLDLKSKDLTDKAARAFPLRDHHDSINTRSASSHKLYLKPPPFFPLLCPVYLIQQDQVGASRAINLELCVKKTQNLDIIKDTGVTSTHSFRKFL